MPEFAIGQYQNDANPMAELLEKAGFKVDRQLDTSLAQLQAVVDCFGVTVRDPKVKFGRYYFQGPFAPENRRVRLVNLN